MENTVNFSFENKKIIYAKGNEMLEKIIEVGMKLQSNLNLSDIYTITQIDEAGIMHLSLDRASTEKNKKVLKNYGVNILVDSKNSGTYFRWILRS